VGDVFDQDGDDADAAYGPAAEHWYVFALARCAMILVFNGSWLGGKRTWGASQDQTQDALVLECRRERDGDHDDWQQETADFGGWRCEFVGGCYDYGTHVVYASY
jgi:hypothetical protein